MGKQVRSKDFSPYFLSTKVLTQWKSQSLMGEEYPNSLQTLKTSLKKYYYPLPSEVDQQN